MRKPKTAEQKSRDAARKREKRAAAKLVVSVAPTTTLDEIVDQLFSPVKPKRKLFFHYEGHEANKTELINKTRRRAKRHFAGKEVRHRVVAKTENSIEFSFFRRTGNPTRVRWRYE